MSIALPEPHSLAIVDALEGFGLNAGNGTGKGLDLPHAVTYLISNSTSGTLGDLNSDSEFVYQVTCTGRKAGEAEWIYGKALGLLDGFVVAGRLIIPFYEDGTGFLERDDDVTPPLFTCKPRFRFLSVPS